MPPTWSECAAGVTVGLVAASLAARSAQAPDAATTSAAAELAARAMQWRETAVQDSDPALRLQHMATALAYMHAARSLARDGDIEQLVGFDVARSMRMLEKRVTEARQSLRTRIGVPNEE